MVGKSNISVVMAPGPKLATPLDENQWQAMTSQPSVKVCLEAKMSRESLQDEP